MALTPFPHPNADTETDLCYTILLHIGGTMADIQNRYLDTKKDILYAIADLLSGGIGGSGGSGETTRIVITPSAGLVTVTDAALTGMDANKLHGIYRGGIMIDVVSSSPSYGECVLNTTAGTITFNATEPTVSGEKITAVFNN